MAWQRLELQLPASRVPAAEALLRLLGSAGIELAGAGDEALLEPAPGTAPLWRQVRIRALFAADVDLEGAARALERGLGGDVAVTVERLPDSEWAGALTSEPRRLAVGARLLITSAQDVADSAGRVVVRLNRGLGFGTGEHPTTRLCLDWLEQRLEPGDTVVDYGCGSGILAVAALCLGAERAWAVDIEPQAIEASRANAALNGVDARLWAGRPGALPSAAAGADVVLANILAGPLMTLAPRLASLVGPSGALVLTGILPEQYEDVAARYRRHFESIERREREGWLRIVAAEPSS